MMRAAYICDAIKKQLSPTLPVILQVIKKASSTNTVISQESKSGAPHGTTLIALSQSAGKGRNGRVFHSPDGTGLYLSTLIRPDMAAADTLVLTALAAMAAQKVCAELSGRDAAIKWVNDIYIGGRKVCGILTEGHPVLQDGIWRTEHAVVGVGINLLPPQEGFPANIRDAAGAVCRDGDGETLLIRAAVGFLERFYEGYASLSAPATKKQILAAYRENLYGMGKEAEFQRGSDRFTGIIRGIGDDLSLILETSEGEQRFTSGEITMIRRPT